MQEIYSRKLNRALVLFATFLGLSWGQLVSAANPLIDNNLIDHYDHNISEIERIVGTAKAHRTALIERMDALGKNLTAMELAADKSNVKNPSLQIETEMLELELANVEAQLRTQHDELSQSQTKLQNIPTPGVFADALADITALEHHRALALWGYRIHRNQREISATSKQRDQLIAAIASTSSRTDAMRETLQRLTEQQQSLVRDKKSLESRFSNLSADIVKQQDRVERMRKRKSLLLENPTDSTNFNKFQGILPDPTAGLLYKRYAEPKAEGLLKWGGILVKAPLGQEIEAVFDGKVVFAGQIQGLGNVAIIDHGWDFMTLYGMAELLVIEEQQTVIAGQVIGTVGESVGMKTSALYFEIRHDAETVNPEDWLSLQQIRSNAVE